MSQSFVTLLPQKPLQTSLFYLHATMSEWFFFGVWDCVVSCFYFSYCILLLYSCIMFNRPIKI